jgi:hypothetical protein
MVLEYLGLANIYLNSFFGQHVIFISHVLAAVFLILSESTINYRVIAPLMDMVENTFFGRWILVPNLFGTLFFIIWATFSIYIYEILFNWLLKEYQQALTGILIVCFFIIMYIVNIRYRD